MKKLADIQCRLRYLTDKLPYLAKDARIEIFGDPDMDRSIDAVSLYSDEEKTCEPSYLYLCRPEHLRQIRSAYQEGILLCVNNGTHLEQVPEGYHIIVMECKEDLAFVFNELQRTIINLKTNNILMNRAIMEKMNLHEILEIAEKTIKNPFLLLDAEFGLLGWSRTKTCPDPLYTETVTAGRIPHGYIMKLIEHDSLRKLYIQGTTVLSPGQLLEEYSVVMVVLKEENMVIGYGMLICSSREPRKPMIQGFQEIIGKFRTCLAAKSDVSYFQEKSEHFFYLMLLNESMTDASEIQSYAEELQICVAKERICHVLQCGDSLPIQYVLKNLVHTVIDSEAAFVYGTYIVVIESGSNGQSALAEKAAYQDFLKEYKAIAGLSAVFYRIQDIRRAYRQAEDAVRMNGILAGAGEELYIQCKGPVCRYGRMLPYLLVHREYQETKYFPVTRMNLLRLIWQDEKRKTDYAHTLFVYLKNNGHVIETAQEMYFHRNSILHRIKQISDFLQLNLSDHKVREELFFNFRVIDYAKAIGKMEELMAMAGEEGK